MTHTDQQNVPKLRFPGFDRAWEMVPLSEKVDSIKSGRTKHAEAGDLPVYGSTGLIGFTDKAEFAGQNLLVARVGANAGQLNMADGRYGVTDNTLVVTPSDQIDLGFLEASLRRFNLNQLVFGSGQPLVTGTMLKRLKRAFPTLPEQRKIASFLGAVDTKIAQLARKKALLEDYKKGCMLQLFSQQTRFKDDNDQDFPAWEEKLFGSLGHFTGGGTPDTNVEDYWMGDIPWVSSSDLSEGLIRRLKITRWITQEAIKASATQITPEGAILIVTRVGIGKCAIAPEDLCTSQDFTNFVPEEGVTIFFAYWLTHNQSKIQSLAQGTSIKGVTAHDLKALKIQVPHPAEQHKIADFLSALDTKIDLIGQELTHARRFKQGLLQQMFV